MDKSDSSRDKSLSQNDNLDSDDDQSSKSKFNIFIKLLDGTKHNVEVHKDTFIHELKDLIARMTSISSTDQRLVSTGRILDNFKKLKDYNISKDDIIFVLKARRPNPTTPTTTSSSSPAATPASQPPQAANFNNMNLNIPDSVFNSMTRMLMDRPDFLRTIFDSNPLLSELRERNPELSHILNDPQMLRESMEMLRNPALFREMTRTTDRAMSNIEAIPGGFNALRRMYQNFQEPLWNATMDRRSGDSNNSEDSTQPYNLGTDQPPSSEALPNPWDNSSSRSWSRNNAPLNFPPFQNFLTQPNNPRPNVDQASNASLNTPQSNTSPNISTQTTNPTPQSSPPPPNLPQNTGPAENNIPQNINFQNMPPFPGFNMMNFANFAPMPFSPIQPNQNTPSPNTSATTLSSETTSTTPENSEARFRTQLNSLRDMGFTDTQSCIQALEQSGGNLNRAIDRLLNQ